MVNWGLYSKNTFLLLEKTAIFSRAKGSFCKRDVFLFFSENSLYAERTPKMIPSDLHGHGMPLADKYSNNLFTTQGKKDALNSAQSNPIRHPYEPIWFNLLPLILR